MNSFKIFILDDDVFSIAFAKQALLNLGYTNVHSFINPDDLITSLETETPDIIFLDYQMEPNNGLDIMYSIQNRYPPIKVIFLSGQDQVQIGIDAIRFGAFDYIVKGAGAFDRMDKALKRIEENSAA